MLWLQKAADWRADNRHGHQSTRLGVGTAAFFPPRRDCAMDHPQMRPEAAKGGDTKLGACELSCVATKPPGISPGGPLMSPRAPQPTTDNLPTALERPCNQLITWGMWGCNPSPIHTFHIEEVPRGTHGNHNGHGDSGLLITAF